ncbi:MAG: hypothetical protein Q7K39_04820 [Candidatus Magasanikbacteria bacterium]|nr:hypothetical protein [Candidatus Magasanikbacteria bacterium]
MTMPARIAFIFDMDGVVVDSIPYHKAGWKKFIEENGKKFTDKFFDAKINAKRAPEIMRAIFGKKMTLEKIWKIDELREAK